MRALRLLLAIPLLLTVAAAQQPKPSPDAARRAYRDALAAEQRNDFAAALASLRAAIDLAPGNAAYLAALAQLKAQVVHQDLKNGDQALAAGRIAEAIAQFGASAELDPTNSFARQRLRDAQARLPHQESALDVVNESGEIELAPKVQTAGIHFNGDSRGLLTQVAAAFGLEAKFDDDFQSRAAALDVNNATLEQALQQATAISNTMWIAETPNEIFFAANTPEKHRQFDRMVLRTFYLRDFATPQELNDLSSVLRAIFDIRYVVVDTDQKLITLKAPQPILDSASRLLAELSAARPQVMLDVQAYEISSNFLRQIGVNIPVQFQILNIPPQIIQQLQSGNLQQQIQQILNGGTLTPDQLTALQALEAQLQNLQQTGLTNLLNQPFVTFGHGHTLFAVTYPGNIALVLSSNSSYVSTLDHASLRAAQGDTATLLIGTRYPVLTSTFALPGQTANVGLSTFPTFNYEDLGITLKAKPAVHLYPLASNGIEPAGQPSEITLDLDLTIKALGGTSFNGVPVISNREYRGMVRLKDGEPALVVGSITRDQERSLSGIPGLGRIPVLGRAFSTSSTNNTADEVMIMITPHVVRLPGPRQSTAIWLPPSGQ